MSLQRRLSLQELSVLSNKNDVTDDLKSLSFEHSLSPDEHQYLILRTRYHAFTLTSCAHAAYIVGMLNQLRKELAELHNPVNKNTVKFFGRQPLRDPLKIGLIGCGRLGKQIASSLLTFSDVRPNELFISTRRPDALGNLQAAGIHCMFDNREVVSLCDVVFICCLPANIQQVAEDIAGYIQPNCVVFSYVVGVSLPRLRQLFQHNNMGKMEFTWSVNNVRKPWQLGDDVVSGLEQNRIVELCCPISEASLQDGVIWSSAKTIEIAVFSALNMCPKLNITCEEAIAILNQVFLAPQSDEKLTWEHFLDEESLKFIKTGNFPVFDLFHVCTEDTPFTQHLENNLPLRNSISKKFVHFFTKLRALNE